MSPFKWFLLFVVLVSAIWLWPLYLLIAFVTVSAMFGSKHTRSRKSTYKPFKFKTAKRTVYKAPRYPKSKPYNKGRLLKSGMRQHYRNGGWTPKAIKKNLPD